MSMDVSGCWFGHYMGEGEANRFIALIEEADGRVSGNISEPDDLGVSDLRRATVSGARTGSEVTFTKQYDGDVLAHAVEYAGVLDDSGVVVRGSWSFEGYSGTFLMEREIFNREELADEEEAPVPVTTEEVR
jgi:hypothetical protein